MMIKVDISRGVIITFKIFVVPSWMAFGCLVGKHLMANISRDPAMGGIPAARNAG